MPNIFFLNFISKDGARRLQATGLHQRLLKEILLQKLSHPAYLHAFKDAYLRGIRWSTHQEAEIRPMRNSSSLTSVDDKSFWGISACIFSDWAFFSLDSLCSIKSIIISRFVVTVISSIKAHFQSHSAKRYGCILLPGYGRSVIFYYYINHHLSQPCRN